MTTIRIVRTGILFGLFTKMKIFVDGALWGEIGFHKDITIPVEPGKHQIRVSLNFIRSDLFEVMVQEGQNLGLECGMPSGIANKLKAFYSPDNVLFLRSYDLIKE